MVKERKHCKALMLGARCGMVGDRSSRTLLPKGRQSDEHIGSSKYREIRFRKRFCSSPVRAFFGDESATGRKGGRNTLPRGPHVLADCANRLERKDYAVVETLGCSGASSLLSTCSLFLITCVSSGKPNGLIDRLHDQFRHQHNQLLPVCHPRLAPSEMAVTRTKARQIRKMRLQWKLSRRSQDLSKLHGPQ